jgi:hypothetical protein
MLDFELSHLFTIRYVNIFSRRFPLFPTLNQVNTDLVECVGVLQNVDGGVEMQNHIGRHAGELGV